MHSPDGGLLGGPPSELSRSVAADAVGRMARASGLFAAHFEHRVELPLPEHWEVPDADLGPYPWAEDGAGGWRAGVLHETKFRTFRLDRRIASFHPAHGAKWASHELCHGLVGFAWKPGAGPLWHATAARLAELVPVALWYFFDEAGLQRCPRHAGGGGLFGAPCPACAARAAEAPGRRTGPDLARWRRQGRAYVEAEIDAAWRTLASGIPVSHRYGTLDLCTDGLAYARAHGPVLASSELAEWVERFCTEGRGWHADLEGLVARSRDIVAALCDEGDAPPLDGHAGTWIAQDLGWRLLQLRAELDGEVAGTVDGWVDRLADAAGALSAAEARAVVAGVIDDYTALFDEVVLPPPEQMFAVGYPLPRGHGSGIGQLAEGVASALPVTAARLGDTLEVQVERFAADDPRVRAGIGERFAAWARVHLDAMVADQAALEAAVVHVSAPDPAARTLAGQVAESALWSRARHVRVVVLSHDVGADLGEPGSGLPLDTPVAVAVVRGLDGARELLALDVDTAAALRDGVPPAPLEALGPEGPELLAAGLMEPDRWAAEGPG